MTGSPRSASRRAPPDVAELDAAQTRVTEVMSGLVAGSPTGTSTTGAQFGRLLVAFSAQTAIQFNNRSSTELCRPRPNNHTCSHAGALHTIDLGARHPLATMLY
jgi:hypothetical protein